MLAGYRGDKKSLSLVNISSDGRKGLTVDQKGNLSVWDLESGRIINMFSGVTDVRRIYMSDNSERVIASTTSEDLVVWDKVKNTRRTFQPRRLRGHSFPIESLRVTSDGKKAITGSIDGAIRFWDLDDGTCFGQEGHSGAVRWVDSSPSGDVAVSVSEDPNFNLENILKKGSIICCRDKDGKLSKPFSIEAEKNNLRPSSLCFWRGHDAQCLSKYAFDYPLQSLSITPDGKKTISVCDSTIISFDQKGKPKWFDTDQDQVLAIFFPDGKSFLSGSRDGSIRLWDYDTGASSQLFKVSGPSLEALDLSPDGKIIVSAAGTNLEVWDLAIGKCRGVLTGHEKEILSIKISPDGRKIVSGGRDNTLRIWNLRNGECLNIIQGSSRLGTFHSGLPRTGDLQYQAVKTIA